MPTGPLAAVVGLLLAGLLGMAACGTPPELQERRGGTVPAPRSTPSVPASGATPTATPPARTRTPDQAGPTGFSESVAVPCAGRPSGQQVLSLVRDTDGLLPGGVRISIKTGPLCAGAWQYSVVTVRGGEPLQVVTNGPPGDLNLITAGTDVCSVPVRATAPYGIRAIACDGILPPTGQPTGYGR
ncbi:hypothetical protein O7627_00200 [Solwaraspora sp. WMMD1047]|uniref:hypothetical protein n=1 Tax=Solwaraspora sp. WMMD1047 TaxID=3016102 RepID=UPI0024168E27|nr:hypothetical protein [Solwaraspora sp. WMMD1047]MDG4827724.1 hypothetical protein [Solwaraspora sp. WMMD1047]